jgi:chemotaxis protein methyltransferase CheR
MVRAASTTGTFDRDLVFTTADFNRIRDIVMNHAGISLADHKRELVYGRLSKRLRLLGLPTFAEYCRYVDGNEAELVELINAITTNLTAFFRESYHFDHLREEVLPELLQRNAATRRIRIWSAGCSTGEEPYSIAMTVREVIPEDRDWNIRILATDIDSNVLAKAQAGIYPDDRVAQVPTHYLRRYFRRGTGQSSGTVRVNDEIRGLVAFRRLNLMDPWPMRGPFDVIFCRNVLIYFDKPTQAKLIARYADLLSSGSHLFVGHSETLFRISDRFDLIGRTIYRKR